MHAHETQKIVLAMTNIKLQNPGLVAAYDIWTRNSVSRNSPRARMGWSEIVTRETGDFTDV